MGPRGWTRVPSTDIQSWLCWLIWFTISLFILISAPSSTQSYGIHISEFPQWVRSKIRRRRWVLFSSDFKMLMTNRKRLQRCRRCPRLSSLRLPALLLQMGIMGGPPMGSPWPMAASWASPWAGLTGTPASALASAATMSSAVAISKFVSLFLIRMPSVWEKFWELGMMWSRNAIFFFPVT